MPDYKDMDLWELQRQERERRRAEHHKLPDPDEDLWVIQVSRETSQSDESFRELWTAYTTGRHRCYSVTSPNVLVCLAQTSAPSFGASPGIDFRTRIPVPPLARAFF